MPLVSIHFARPLRKSLGRSAGWMAASFAQVFGWRRLHECEDRVKEKQRTVAVVCARGGGHVAAVGEQVRLDEGLEGLLGVDALHEVGALGEIQLSGDGGGDEGLAVLAEERELNADKPRHATNVSVNRKETAGEVSCSLTGGSGSSRLPAVSTLKCCRSAPSAPSSYCRCARVEFIAKHRYSETNFDRISPRSGRYSLRRRANRPPQRSSLADQFGRTEGHLAGFSTGVELVCFG